MKKVVLLDLDGTLGDTAPGIKESVCYAISKLGLEPLTDSQLNEFIGPPIFDALSALGLDKETVERGVALYRESYSTPTFMDPEGGTELLPGMLICSAFDGILEMMQQLQTEARENGWIIITGTSKPEPWARAVAKKIGIWDYFTPIEHLDVSQSGEEEHFAPNSPHHASADGERVATLETDGIFGASMDQSRAHKDAVLRYALSTLGGEFSEDGEFLGRTIDGEEFKAILVGDRKHDINGARQVGIPVVGCRWGYAVPGEIESADFVIEKPADLVPLLETVL